MPLILIGTETWLGNGTAGQMAQVGADDLPYVVTAVASSAGVSEACVVSTGQRTEVYAVGDDVHTVYDSVIRVLSDHLAVRKEELDDHMYVDTGTSVVGHLLRVSCGVGDTIVERDPVCSVSHAWEVAKNAGASRTALNLLFHHAIESGNEYRRSDTGSVEGAARRAVTGAYKTSGGTGIAVVVIGAGGLGEAVASFAATRPETGAVVLAHSDETKTARAADRAGVVPDGLDHVPELLDWSDVVFYARDTPRTVIDAATLSAVSARRERQLVFCDLSETGSVEPYEDENIVRIGVDDLLASSAEEAAPFILSAVRSWEQKVALRAHAPVIAELHRKADRLRELELQRHSATMRTMNDEQKAAMVAMSRGLVAKLLHEPSTVLRTSSNSVSAEKLTAAVVELFNIQRI